VLPSVPPRYATVVAEGEDRCVVTSVGSWSRHFLVWTILLGFDITILGPSELVAEGRAVAGRLGAGFPT